MGWFGGRKADLTELLRRGRYRPAAELLREELAKGGSPHLRLQLAEVLIKAGELTEAGVLLMDISDDFVKSGQLAKAIALLKRLQRVDPREAVAERIAHLIKESQAERRAQEESMEVQALQEAETLELDLHFDEAMEIRDEPAVASGTDLPAAEPEEPTETPKSPSTAAESNSFFDLFPESELAALIDGMVLQSYEPGDIVVIEGAPGDSLFVLTFGRVKTFVRDGDGHARLLREMSAGDFFGEVALLRGTARTATVTAATRVELLELGRPALRDIAERHPKVGELVERFCEERAGSADESRIRASSTTTS